MSIEATTRPAPSYLPKFSQIDPSGLVEALTACLDDNRKKVDALVAMTEAPTWENFAMPLETLGDDLSKLWSPVSHLNSVVNTDELRDAYNACLPLLSAYWTEMGQHQGLYQRYKAFESSDAYEVLDSAQKRVIHNIMQGFTLSGIALPAEQQKRFGEISQSLSELTTKFSENVLDATGAWTKHITDVSELDGLPQSALDAAAQAAQAKSLEGWLITLDFPSYFPVLTYAHNRELREEVYTAYATRASEQGPNAGEFDNTQVMNDILTLRQELATLLGFENYGEYSLATKMAENGDQVVGFLRDLGEKSLPGAKQDMQELQAFAESKGFEGALASWDVGYYSEQLKQEKYDISQEVLRPYFPMPKVLNGLFEVAKRLFNIDIQKVAEFDTWHKDAQLFEIARAGEVIAHFYLDPYAREKKRGGAWMDDYQGRRVLDDGAVQLPVAYLVCNFNGPVGDTPALLTHNEVTTLFHEFGHGIHHMLTRIDYADVSGINGVAWDAVELPSQFLENWCWEPEALALISGHHETGETLPKDLLDKMLAAKNFQSGMMMVRQLEFSLFDFILHQEYQAGKTDVQAVLDKVRSEVAVMTPPSFNRFQHGFTHIFAGGYAAGYYSYKWAEVLSADAFSKFEEDGIFNEETGKKYLDCILSQGGSKEAMELFVDFMGREPSVDALLRHSGI